MRGVSLRAAAIAVILGAVSGTICAADGPVVSGTVNTMVHTAVGTGSFPDFHFGAEEYANLRLKAGVGERGTVHAAVNLIASSGTNSAAVVASGAAVGENYTATMELERLYVRILGDSSDTDFGLMRIAFGYGQAFRPTDILNPPNPLLPEARPRGILGIATAVYPSLDIKVQGFAAGGRDPLESDGGGMLSGASVDAHFSQGSFQALYAFQSPGDDSREGINRFGFSLKLEAGAGIVLDALYALEPGFEAAWMALKLRSGRTIPSWTASSMPFCSTCTTAREFWIRRTTWTPSMRLGIRGVPCLFSTGETTSSHRLSTVTATSPASALPA